MTHIAKRQGQSRPPRRNGPRGSPPFTPTLDQRAAVKVMSGMRMTLSEISLCVVNPHTERPIAIKTLRKFFADELEVGWASVKSLVGRRYIEALNAGEPWAIRAGLTQFFGWNADGTPQVDISGLESDEAVLAEFEHLLAGIREARAIEAAASTPTIEGSATEVMPSGEPAPDEPSPIVPLPPQRGT